MEYGIEYGMEYGIGWNIEWNIEWNMEWNERFEGIMRNKLSLANSYAYNLIPNSKAWIRCKRARY